MALVHRHRTPSKPTEAPGYRVSPMLGRIARLLQARGTATTGSRGCLQQVRSKGNDSSSPSSPIGQVQSELAALYQSIDREARQHFTNNLGMGSFSQRAAEILRGMQAAMKAAAGQRSGSSGSSTGSNLTASSVGPSLLHYADLLGQYNSYSASQRRQLLEGLQMQLLPRVNAMVGLPVPSPPPTSTSPVPQPQHRSSSSRSRDSSRRPAPAHPAVAAGGVVNQQQQQQPWPRALKRLVGPRRGPSAPEMLQQQPQAAPEQQHVSSNQIQQQEQKQLQTVEQQQPGSAEAGAVGSLQQQQQPGLQDQPQQQQQKQQGVVRRRVGPPRSPGPPRHSSSPVSTTPISSDSSPAPAAAAEHPAPAGAAGQSVQPPQQPEQQQQQQQQAGPFRPHMSGPGPHTPRGALRVHSAPHGTLQPPARPGAARAPPAGEQAAQASPQQQPQQQHSQVQPTLEASTSSSRRSDAKGPVPARPLLRSVSASGPYLPRRHTPYPPAATQPELMRLHQQQRQQQQQQGLLPAWQLYWPLPEELGGPARPQQQKYVAAAAAAAATATVPTDGTSVLQQPQLEQLHLQVTDPAVASAADPSSSSGSDTDEGSGNSSSRKGSTRDKALTEQKWQALLASARRHHEHLQQEQQRQQQEAAGELKQRSGAWLRLRQSRLTGSALANMLSWFDGQDRADHVRLWREKLGLQRPPPPNEKMLYGTRKEHHALSSYQQLAPHEMLQEMGFALWGSDSAHDWLAASPDGLITSAGLKGLSSAAGAGAGDDAVGVSEEVAAWVKQQTGSSLDGVLEIKCPYKASPQVGSPYLPRKMDPYYMPQVQVLCEVLEREWAVVYYWSEGQGSHMTLVHRDRDYFGLLWRAMADFWWCHLVPAKLLLEADPSATDTIERMYTPRVHPYRAEIIRRSKVLVDAAPQRTFTAEETVGHLQPGAAATADAATGAAGAAAQPPAATTLAAADAAGRV